MSDIFLAMFLMAVPTSFDRQRKRLDLSREMHGQRRSDKG
ncbi:hypothetical protein PR003_g11491 [Phytophthora rubi]|uniref:Uncharacterized protein n=1 Tax=Phytophthora rubi TaxID=129364 RepID=A0A6A3N7A1_9STRA|nr:hypothetical protein PR002_g6529 [Phytophthora rubi]KAE9046635.1 hypothetical protein PR001_g4477 [Phytophthora rubi]KAE9338443.1 hypothetical protein PR003_g11491 [Phytophthora rubi]